MDKLILRTVMSILLIIVFKKANSQSSSYFIKKYHKISVFGQYGMDKKGKVNKEDESIGYGLLSFKSYQVGVLYNVLQYKNWNFKTGLIFKFKKIKEHFLFTKEQTGLDRNISFTIIVSSSSKMNAIPLIAEYIVPISKRIKWEIAPSFTFAYYTGQEGDGGNIHGLNPNPASIFEYYDGYNKNPLFTSAEISTGFYILFKHFMLQPEFRYSKSFRDVLTGHYIVENYRTEPHNSKGTFKQSGDYWGFSLSIYIKKKGKNKKK